MSKTKAATAGTLLQDLFQFGLYKRSQGRIARQVTALAIWAAFALGCWKLYQVLTQVRQTVAAEYWVPGVLLLVGIWLGVRVVNVPRFADFLIAVEAEMNKVSWPSRGELMRSSMVVIFVIFSLAAILFAYDVLWQTVFSFIGVRG